MFWNATLLQFFWRPTIPKITPFRLLSVNQVEFAYGQEGLLKPSVALFVIHVTWGWHLRNFSLGFRVHDFCIFLFGGFWVIHIQIQGDSSCFSLKVSWFFQVVVCYIAAIYSGLESLGCGVRRASQKPHLRIFPAENVIIASHSQRWTKILVSI